jgi:cell division protein FtsN
MFDQGPFFLVYTRAPDNPPRMQAAESVGEMKQEEAVEIKTEHMEAVQPAPEPTLPESTAPTQDTAPIEEASAPEQQEEVKPQTEDLLGLDVVAGETEGGTKPSGGA